MANESYPFPLAKERDLKEPSFVSSTTSAPKSLFFNCFLMFGSYINFWKFYYTSMGFFATAFFLLSFED